MSVLMLKPRVGEMSEMSSLFSFFRIVVFPALSKPLQDQSLVSGTHRGNVARRICGIRSACAYRKSTLISLDFALFFRMIVRSPEGISFALG
jgi:hypothetical protein